MLHYEKHLKKFIKCHQKYFEEHNNKGLTQFLKKFSRKPPFAKGNYAFRKVMHRIFIDRKNNTIRPYVMNLLNERVQISSIENYNTETKIGNLPYLFTNFGSHEISLLVDTGSDTNLHSLKT